MPFLHGQIYDAQNGQPLAAKVHVLDAGGRPSYPAGAVRKVGPGLPGFYADGEFLVEVAGGLTTIEVERGTEYVPFRWVGQVPWGATTDLSMPLARWLELPRQGWYPGNTHIHYDEHEANPDARLRLDPQVHDLHVTVVSILERGDLPYAVNRYPVGLLNDFACAHHVVDCGEECRHNREPWTIGYGHVLFLRLQQPVLPVSRGLLVDAADPDYPPLCYACDDARRQGGLAIWCHNGAGMEAPVAAALGKLDALNLFDPYQVLPEEYGLWYRLLNCGLRLPASTGSDWFICSNNRVYVQSGGEFTYDRWLAGLAAGRSFITNGPALFLRADSAAPGETLAVTAGQEVEVEVTWLSHYPVDRVELVLNGEIAAAQQWDEGRREGRWRVPLIVAGDGWLAARVSGATRDSFWQPVFAHTSPVWIAAGKTLAGEAVAARSFVQALDEAMDWIRTRGRFADARQQSEVLELYRAAQTAYAEIARRSDEVF